jgi:hypothetical protein
MHRSRAQLSTQGSLTLLLTLFTFAAFVPAPAQAVLRAPAPAALASTEAGSGSLESAAAKAGETGRKVAMSLIALGFAIASIVLAFRRDFKEAAGIFAIGLVAILLATPAGVNVLHDTVNSLFGTS